MSLKTYKRDNSYYSELYDSFTIEECKRTEKGLSEKDLPEYKGHKITTEEWSRLRIPFTDLALYFLKGEHFAKKSETINKWLEEDRKKEEKFDNAKEPKGIRCLGCSSLQMTCISKDFMTDRNSNQEEVLFMFECDHCHKRRAFWESGKEWEYIPKCPECQADLHAETTRNEDSITAKEICTKCDYKETSNIDLTLKKVVEEKIDPNFASDQKKYCLSEVEGNEYIRDRESMKYFSDKLKDEEENKEVFEEVKNIQKLTIIELQNLLAPLVEKANYTQFLFEKPVIEKDVILSFSLQDTKTGRTGMESTSDLKRLVKKALVPTNWRLMSEGLTYRLGFLQGRLRGVEGEEALRKLAEKSILKKSKK